MADTEIAVEGVSKSFGPVNVLHDIDLTVKPGEFLCLLGPSGCGKTTLLRCIAGLERPDRGRIAIGRAAMVDTAQDLFVPPERRRLGMVFQHYALWPHMTVGQHIAYPLRKQNVPRNLHAEKIAQVMKVVGLPDLLERRPSQLSGGQQQRVALARALVYEPPVLLLDEPLSNLDATLRVQLRRELRQLHERLGTTTVLVTHDQEEAAALADTIAVLHRGRVVQLGTASDILDRPQTRFVAEFVGFDNFIRGRVWELNGERVLIALPCGAVCELTVTMCPPPGTDVIIAARSDSLRLRTDAPSDHAALRGTIRRVARIGRGIEYEVIAGEQVIVVREPGQEARLTAGTAVQVDFSKSRPALVASES